MTTVHLDEDGKTPSIIGYLTIIGWLIAYFALHKGKETSLGSYHLRQTLLFHLVSVVCSWVLGALGSALIINSPLDFNFGSIINFILLIFWIIGLVAAIQGKKKPIPLMGEKAQTLFSSI